MIYPQKFNFNYIKGISKKTLNEHYKLYKGYVKKVNEISNLSEKINDFAGSNPTFSKMRSLKLGESYALDGVKLHRLYFSNLDYRYSNPYGEIMNLINRDFGGYERFVKYFKSVGMSMRGWCVLTLEPLDDTLHIIGQDSHDMGATWGGVPLLVLDVYEHAYFIDYGTNRSLYIDAFMENINWKIVNKRLLAHKMRTI